MTTSHYLTIREQYGRDIEALTVRDDEGITYSVTVDGDVKWEVRRLFAHKSPGHIAFISAAREQDRVALVYWKLWTTYFAR